MSYQQWVDVVAVIVTAAAFTCGVVRSPWRWPHTKRRAEPVLAWKTALVVREGGRWYFRSMTGMRYGADARAECYPPRLHEAQPHDPPVRDCRCGFYAMRDRKDVGVSRHGVLLRVELSGRVIECEHGYRGARQRVLGVAVPRCCDTVRWSDRHCEREAVVFEAPDVSVITIATYAARPYCAEHAFGDCTPVADVLAALGVERQPT